MAEASERLPRIEIGEGSSLEGLTGHIEHPLFKKLTEEDRSFVSSVVGQLGAVLLAHIAYREAGLDQIEPYRLPLTDSLMDLTSRLNAEARLLNSDTKQYLAEKRQEEQHGSVDSILNR